MYSLKVYYIEVHKEKKTTYETTLSYYKTKYKLQEIEVLGVMVGARGNIPRFLLTRGDYLNCLLLLLIK